MNQLALPPFRGRIHNHATITLNFHHHSVSCSRLFRAFISSTNIKVCDLILHGGNNEGLEAKSIVQIHRSHC